MSWSTLARERLAWTAAVAVLSTSLAWLGIINLALFVSAHEMRFAPALVVAKALVRVAGAVLRDSGPLVAAALVVSALILVAVRAAVVGGARERNAP